MIRRYQDLRVWQAARTLAFAVYKLTAKFPREEQYGITSQMRRSALSISNNVAEGSKRKSRADFAHFLNIAEGSAAETSNMLSFALGLEYASSETIDPLLEQSEALERMLASYRKYIEREER